MRAADCKKLAEKAKVLFAKLKPRLSPWFWGSFCGELVLAHCAQGALEISRDILPLGTGGNAALGIALGFVVFPTANVANIFHGDYLRV